MVRERKRNEIFEESIERYRGRDSDSEKREAIESDHRERNYRDRKESEFSERVREEGRYTRAEKK